MNFRASLVLAVLLALWYFRGGMWLFAALFFCAWIVGCHFENWLWKKARESVRAKR